MVAKVGNLDFDKGGLHKCSCSAGVLSCSLVGVGVALIFFIEMVMVVMTKMIYLHSLWRWLDMSMVEVVEVGTVEVGVSFIALSCCSPYLRKAN